jgi:hypothetical protein
MQLLNLIISSLCKHKWKQISSDRYNVIESKGAKEGEVTLTLYECKKCKKNLLVPTDRSHIKIHTL